MKFLRLLLLITVTLGLAPRLAVGADETGQFAIKSVGTTNCERYLQARKKGGNEYVLYGGYLGGFVTAYNHLAPGTFDLLPWENVDTLAAMLASYCQKNPKDNFTVAMLRLVAVLKPRQIDSASPTVEAASGGKTVKIYEETLQRAQKELTKLGYYSGQQDGHFDAATRQGIEKFQEAKKLPKTGLPDQATLFHLLLAKSE